MKRISIILFLALSDCTVSPKPVLPTAIAFDKNEQTAGIVDCDRKGCLVTAGYIERYREMEKEFASTVSGDSGIIAEGANFRVNYEVITHFAQMRAAQRGP